MTMRMTLKSLGTDIGRSARPRQRPYGGSPATGYDEQALMASVLGVASHLGGANSLPAYDARSVVIRRIPYDAHLEGGAVLELDQFSAVTHCGCPVRAATIGNGFVTPVALRGRRSLGLGGRPRREMPNRTKREPRTCRRASHTPASRPCTVRGHT
jgi:hypothetical protein